MQSATIFSLLTLLWYVSLKYSLWFFSKPQAYLLMSPINVSGSDKANNLPDAEFL